MTRGTVVVLSLILATAACSNGGTGSGDKELTAEEAQAVAELERGYPTSSWADDSEGPAEVHCLAVGMVADFGIDNLQKYGVVDANLEFDQASLEPMSEPDAEQFVDIAFGCGGGDYEADVAEFIRDDAPSLSDSDVSRCVQAVTEDDLREAYEGFLREDAEPLAALYRKLHKAGCRGLYTD
jgi:hypothetical protein